MMKELFADYIFRNGKIITVNESDDIAEAVAVKGNRILEVGTEEEIWKYFSDNTNVINLNGRTLLPGFVETHIHFTSISMLEGGLVIQIKDAESIEEIREMLRKAVAAKKPGEWIYMEGYDHNKLKEKRHPSRWDFDDIAPDNPVSCTRICHHMSVYNTYAMNKGGIFDESEFENPDEAMRDENGRLTGLFKESLQAKLAGDYDFNEDECLRAFKCAEKYLHSYGITSVHDMGSGLNNYGRNILQDAVKKGMIKERLYMIWCSLDGRVPGLAAANRIVDFGPHTGIGNEWYKMGPIKLLLDGSTSGPSCYMKEPYEHDKELKGVMNYPYQEEINELFLKAAKNGFQVTAHAVGDGAVEAVLNAYEYVDAEYPLKDRRFKIEHSGFTFSENIERIRRMGVVPVSNPSFITINGADYKRFYGDRVNMMFPSASYKEKGVVEAYGTDCPVTEPNPLMSIYAAMTRHDNLNDTVCGENQKVDLFYAIKCCTLNGAYASFEDDIKGSIEEGKLADMIILSDDITSCDVEDIKNMKVDMTMIDGEVVYERN